MEAYVPRDRHSDRQINWVICGGSGRIACSGARARADEIGRRNQGDRHNHLFIGRNWNGTAEEMPTRQGIDIAKTAQNDLKPLVSCRTVTV